MNRSLLFKPSNPTQITQKKGSCVFSHLLLSFCCFFFCLFEYFRLFSLDLKRNQDLFSSLFSFPSICILSFLPSPCQIQQPAIDPVKRIFMFAPAALLQK